MKLLGEILVNNRNITDIQLFGALTEQKRTKDRLGRILLKRKMLSESDLARALSEQSGMIYTTLDEERIDWKTVQDIMLSTESELNCVPLYKNEKMLTVATVNRQDHRVDSELHTLAGPRYIRWVVISDSDMVEACRQRRQMHRNRIRDQLSA